MFVCFLNALYKILLRNCIDHMTALKWMSVNFISRFLFLMQRDKIQRWNLIFFFFFFTDIQKKNLFFFSFWKIMSAVDSICISSICTGHMFWSRTRFYIFYRFRTGFLAFRDMSADLLLNSTVNVQKISVQFHSQQVWFKSTYTAKWKTVQSNSDTADRNSRI